MSQNDRLIVALDVSTLAEVKQLVDELGDDVSFYKVGMQLYYSQGNQVLEFLRQRGKQIFLDLKLHDIPNTVAHSAAVLAGLGASLLTLHASGGQAMLQQASQAVKAAAIKAGQTPPKLVAVTVLTSMSTAEWRQMGHTMGISDQVLRLAEVAKLAGMDGVVASPQEAAAIRQSCGEDFLIVTPGIRPAGAAMDDQSRTATPALALSSGASHLVVGRPITAATNRGQAARQILSEMRDVK